MTRDELGQMADVLDLFTQILDGVIVGGTSGDAIAETIDRIAVVKIHALSLASELRVDAGYVDRLPDAPLRDLTQRATRLRQAIADGFPKW